MIGVLKAIILAIRKALAAPQHTSVFLLLAVLIFTLYVFLPVVLIPGNSVALQLSITRGQDYILFAVLSLATALLIMMHVYLFSQKKGKLSGLAQGGTGIASGLFGGLLATAACSSCIASIIGFLGSGSVFFVVENRTPISIASFALLLGAVAFTAKRIDDSCRECDVTHSMHSERL